MKKLKPLFNFGRVVVTRGFRAAAEKTGQSSIEFVVRHVYGDWGNICEHDKGENLNALKHGGRIFSMYDLSDGQTFYVITEADRSVTTLLLPLEY